MGTHQEETLISMVWRCQRGVPRKGHPSQRGGTVTPTAYIVLGAVLAAVIILLIIVL